MMAAAFATRISTPPWVRHPTEARFWVTAVRAAREWFRKSERHVRRMCSTGELAGVFETFFDGHRWWIRLPEKLKKPQRKGIILMLTPTTEKRNVDQGNPQYRGTVTGLVGAKKLKVAYSDESGCGSIESEPISVVAACIMNLDKCWPAVESEMVKIGAACPTSLLHAPFGPDNPVRELKGSNLYSAARKNIPEAAPARDILSRILAITVNEGIPIYYGAVDRKGWDKVISARAAASTQDRPADPKRQPIEPTAADRAFDACAALVDKFASSIDEHVLWIADHSDPKRELTTKVGLPWLRSLKGTGFDPITYKYIKPNYDRVRIADAIYFGHSHESLALELADVCCSTITLHLLEKFYSWRPIVEPFYEIIRGGGALMNDTEPEYRNFGQAV